jgi:hypothetical protein
MRSTYINFALIDTGYTCSSDLGSREKDTARVKVKTNTKCQLILFLLRKATFAFSFFFFGRQKVKVDILFLENTLRDLVLTHDI